MLYRDVSPVELNRHVGKLVGLPDFDNALSEYHCTLRIHPERVAFVKWLMPGRWKLVGDADDKGWITISLVMDSDLLVKMLVFGLIGFVEVIAPPELEEAILVQARDLLRTYPKNHKPDKRDGKETEL